MANIKPYIDQIANAVYGEEVRASIINALMKVNNDNESYQEIKRVVIETNDEFEEKVVAAESTRKELIAATESGNAAKDLLHSSIEAAEEKNTVLSRTVGEGQALEANLPDLVKSANTSKELLQSVINDSVTKKADIDRSVENAKQHTSTLNLANGAAEQTRLTLDESIAAGNALYSDLQGTIQTANEKKTNLETAISAAEEEKKKLDGSIDSAASSKTSLDGSIAISDTKKENLDVSIGAATTMKQQLDESLTTGESVKSALDSSVDQAFQSNTQLTETLGNAETAKSTLDASVSTANTTKQNLDASVSTANGVMQSLTSENSAAASNIEELKSENFNSQEILAGVADLRAYLGLADEDILGVQVDYKNKTFTRLAGAVNLTAGANFDAFSMFGGRRRCNVADDGTIVAWHGDADYAEDGSMGQVMVYQPKFYYLVCPVVYDPIDTGIGYHLRKANYYVSEKPRAGFRLHPVFYDANGNEIDYYLTAAYEGSIWDADGGTDGTGAFLMNDEQVMSVAADKFCSIAGVKPASGLTQNLTRPNIEQMAKNRGEGWHGDLIKQVSAEQMLMIIEMGTMNLQTAITQGVVSISDNSSYNCSSLTGSTASIGNGTGKAEQTINEKGGTTTTETANGKTAVCWRGKENFWGNIWKFVYGINIWGNGAMGGGQPYICTDFNFAESKNSGNYEGAGFTIANASGYISAMGYSTKYDWLFIASECLGNSSIPVGDYTWLTTNLDAYRITRLGGGWNDGGNSGAFYWGLNGGVGGRYRYVGGRLVFIPTRDSAAYLAAIESWKEQMQKAA